MSTRYRSLLVAVLLCSVVTAPACYTLLKHPRLASMDYQRPEGDPCANCHSNEEIWSFNHPEIKPSYSGYTGSWTKYYDYAWWYERSWDYQPHTESEKPAHDRSSKPAPAPVGTTPATSQPYLEKGTNDKKK
jgi:hypothetical protein